VDCADLEKLISESIDTVSVMDREVRDRNGRWYALRIRPYKNSENRIDGAVLALIDMEQAGRPDRAAAARNPAAAEARERPGH
jgi:hypothetical protein